MTSEVEVDAPEVETAGASTSTLTRSMWVVIAIAVLALTVAGGYAWGNRGDDGIATPKATSVDAGFAWDMSTHHAQAVTMANFV
ncbi:MAG TPA: hypothetical protein VJ831_12095, partial [Jatrophihabitantaceae bacterium]|nr:hypothetical protein [Jatrophihabitantaceae bacterium]